MKRNPPAVDLTIDPFLEKGRAAAAWMGRRTHLLRLGLLVLVLVSVSLAWVNSRRSHQARDASEQLARGIAALTDTKPEAPAEPDAPAPKDADVQTPLKVAQKEISAKLGQARDAFFAATQLAGHQSVGALASVLLADTEARLGHADKAREELKTLLSRLSQNHPAYYLAVQRLAALEENLGNPQAAVGLVAPLANDRALPFSDWAAWSLARLDVVGNNAAQAKERLDRLENDFSQTSRSEDIARLRARIVRASAQKPGS